MGREAHERVIDGDTWTVQQFPATEGLRLMARLAKLLGGPLSAAMGALQGSDLLDAKVDGSLLGKAVAELADRLDEDEVAGLAKRLLKDTRVGGKEVLPQFETLFQGRYLTLFKVLGFVLEVNFQIPLAGWLAVAASQVGAPPAAAAS